jgi:hypothetical protein
MIIEGYNDPEEDNGRTTQECEPSAHMPAWQLALFFIGLLLIVSAFLLACVYETHIAQ